MEKRKDSTLYRNVLLGLVVVLIILYGINIFIAGSILNPLKVSLEKNRSANLHLALITNNCSNCYDMNNFISFIKTQNVKIIQEKNLTYSTTEAQNLISENRINSLPALIITGEVSQENIAPLWNSLGVQPVNNVVVIGGIPPYYILSTQKVVGLVDVIKLTDNSCVECYDVESHMQVLPGFGVYINKSLVYDVSSTDGKILVQKYNITKVPTILLSPDVSVYKTLTQIWSQVGTIESDGWYVFTATGQMGTYKDLSQNKIVNATR